MPDRTLRKQGPSYPELLEAANEALRAVAMAYRDRPWALWDSMPERDVVDTVSARLTQVYDKYRVSEI